MTSELQTFTAGDTVKWTRSFADYPASDGWSVSYSVASVNGSHKFTVAGVEDGAAFGFTLSAALSARVVPGAYYFEAYASKAGERFRATSGKIEVRVNLASDAATYDTRSQARRTLDAINATIEGRASTDQQEYTIGNRSLKRTPIADLIVLKNKYETMVKSEDAAEAIAQGRGAKNRILVRF